jgi:hypothetical protein
MNTAVFSVVNTVLLTSGVSQSPSLGLAGHDPRIGRLRLTPDFSWRKQTRSYEAMAAFGYQRRRSTEQGASRIAGVYVAGDF